LWVASNYIDKTESAVFSCVFEKQLKWVALFQGKFSTVEIEKGFERFVQSLLVMFSIFVVGLRARPDLLRLCSQPKLPPELPTIWGQDASVVASPTWPLGHPAAEEGCCYCYLDCFASQRAE
jgi:hypothetical protein